MIIKDIKAICPATGWYAVFYGDEGLIFNPVAVWAAVRQESYNTKTGEWELDDCDAVLGLLPCPEAMEDASESDDFACYCTEAERTDPLFLEIWGKERLAYLEERAKKKGEGGK